MQIDTLIEGTIQSLGSTLAIHIILLILSLYDLDKKIERRHPGFLLSIEISFPIYVVLFYILSRLPS